MGEEEGTAHKFILEKHSNSKVEGGKLRT